MVKIFKTFKIYTGMLALITSAQISGNLFAAQEATSFKGTVTRTVQLDYLLFMPEAAQKSADKKWPAILFLHGAGERGTDVWKVATHGPPKVVKNNPNFQFIVISPQCPANRWWETDTLVALIEEAQKKHPIDPDRIYLTGLSMGGFGSWSLAAARPDIFAAVAPICGGGNVGDAPKLKDMPLWVFHGAKDTVVPLKQSEDMVNAINAAGNKVKFTVYPEAQHDSWTATYDNPEFYKWLLQNKRK